MSQHINSLSDLDKYVHAWKMDRVQLGRGKYYSHLDAFHTHNVQIGMTHRSMRLAVSGETPSDAITFLIIANDASMIHQKHKMTNRHLAVYESGGEADTVFIEPIRALSISIHRDVFKSKYEEKFQETYPVKSKFELRVCNSEVLEEVKEELIRILEAVRIDRPWLEDFQSMNLIEEIIIDHMLNLLHTSSGQNGESKWVETAHSLYGLIKLRYDQDISIEALCKELNVSQRNAYLTFQKHYSMTPKQYLLGVRLGKIRSALEAADPKHTKIEHIAIQNGFYHMSHFTKLYKSFFGELPSQTLWKHSH